MSCLAVQDAVTLLMTANAHVHSAAKLLAAIAARATARQQADNQQTNSRSLLSSSLGEKANGN
jgi:hypothetical protein